MEFEVVNGISVISGIKPFNTVVMAHPASFAGWLDMLVIFTRESVAHKFKLEKLEKHCEHLRTLLAERNSVVHAVWQRGETGPLEAVMLAGKTPMRAKAMGIPKRGRKVIVLFDKTPAEIRKISSRIVKARAKLRGLVYRQRRASKKTLFGIGLAEPQGLSSPAMPTMPPFSSGMSSRPRLLAEMLRKNMRERK